MPQLIKPIMPPATQRLAEMTKHHAYTAEFITERTGLSSSDIHMVLRGEALLTNDEIAGLAACAKMPVADFLNPLIPLGNPFGEQGRKVERILALRQFGTSSGSAISDLVDAVPEECLSTRHNWRYPTDVLAEYFGVMKKNPYVLTDAFIAVFARNVGVSIEGLFTLTESEIKAIRSYRRAVSRCGKAQQTISETQRKLKQYEAQATELHNAMSEAARREADA